MRANPLRDAAGSTIDRNPLTDPAVAREWAAQAVRDGKPDLAQKWSDHAAKLGG